MLLRASRLPHPRACVVRLDRARTRLTNRDDLAWFESNDGFRIAPDALDHRIVGRGTMRTRIRRTTRGATGAVIVGTVAFALGGCAFITPQEELDDPLVNGTTSIDVGHAKLRGLVVIADGSSSGAAGSCIVVALNDSDRDLVVRLTYPSTSGIGSASLAVPAESSVSRGTRPGQEQLILDDLAAPPGGLLRLQVASGGRHGRVDVPVLSGALPYYATLTPSPDPTSRRSSDRSAAAQGSTAWITSGSRRPG